MCQYYKHVLQSATRTADDTAKHIEDTIAWIKDMKSALAAKMTMTLSDDIDVVEEMLQDQIVTFFSCFPFIWLYQFAMLLFQLVFSLHFSYSPIATFV